MMESDQDHKCMPFSVECCQQKSARPPQHPKPMEAAQCDGRLSACDCALHSMSMRPWQWKRKRRDAGQDAGLAPASMPHGTPAAIRAQQHRHPSHAGRRAQESRDQTQQGAGKVRCPAISREDCARTSSPLNEKARARARAVAAWPLSPSRAPSCARAGVRTRHLNHRACCAPCCSAARRQSRRGDDRGDGHDHHRHAAGRASGRAQASASGRDRRSRHCRSCCLLYTSDAADDTPC
eukprot:5960096-Pleurochrysis_carterae.AAC.1